MDLVEYVRQFLCSDYIVGHTDSRVTHSFGCCGSA